MLRFKQFIAEAKQVGLLYHITPQENFQRILHSDSLGKNLSYTNEVSMTRDKHFNYIPGRHDDLHTIKFHIDGNKLSNNFKVYPKVEKGYGRAESEQRVDKAIKPLGKYLVGIEILHDEMSNEDWSLLRQYLKKYPHIKLLGKVKPPKSFEVKDIVNKYEGYWFKGGVYTIDELIEADPEYYEDWDGMDIGYIKSREYSEEAVRVGVVLVTVKKENPLIIELLHDKKESVKYLNKIQDKIAADVPDAEFDWQEVKLYDRYEDEDDE